MCTRTKLLATLAGCNGIVGLRATRCAVFAHRTRCGPACNPATNRVSERNEPGQFTQQPKPGPRAGCLCAFSMNLDHVPGQPFFHYTNGALQVEQVAVAALAQTYGTPLFVYSKASMIGALAAYQRGFEGRKVQICYAMKANSSLGILRLFASAGCGFDIVSGGELERVLAVAVPPQKIIFSGIGKTRAEMRRALDVGIGCFNVESSPSWTC